MNPFSRPLLRSGSWAFWFLIGNLAPAQSPQKLLLPIAPVALLAAEAAPPRLDSSASKPTAAKVAPEVTAAVREADRHFQTGKSLAQEADPDRARAEFDAAIDILLDVPQTTPDRILLERRFEELSRLIHRYDIQALGSGESPESPVFVQSPVSEILDLTFPVDPRLKDPALAQVRAGQSQLPLAVNDAVLSYVNYFSSARGSKILLYGLKRAGRYRTMISRILAEEGVPQELVHLAQIESAFLPRAVSRKSAAGIWQFVQWRGQQYGLAVTRLMDDRLDPEKATRAAAKHLRDLYEQLGDWYLAMAAYNCGPGCVDRAVQRTGYADFWELRSRGALPKETSNYVPAILAASIMAKNLPSFGLTPPDPDPEMEYDTISINSDTNVALIADAIDRPISDLRDLNPALLKNMVPAGTEIRVPRGFGSPVLAALNAIPANNRNAWRLHRVEKGETLAAIAHRYATPADSIVAANHGLDSTFFQSPETGEMLVIPAAPERQAPVTATKTAARSGAKTAAARKGSPAARASFRSTHSGAKVASLSARNRPATR
jgi:membrane-bound lytic murein transglycosylase D